MGFFTINRKLLAIKAHYFLVDAGPATVQPTMPVYAKVLGFSSFVVGTIYTILPLLALFVKPIFGALADKFKWHRAILIACEVIILVTYFVIQFIPPHPAHSTVNGWSVCSSTAFEPQMRGHFENSQWKCELNPSICEELNISSICTSYSSSSDKGLSEEYCMLLSLSVHLPNPENISTCQIDEDEFTNRETFAQWQFWFFLLMLIGAWSATSVVMTLSDTICIEICGDPHLYGPQRLWGSLGWGIFGLVNGYVIDAFSEEGKKDKNYLPAFYLMIVPLLMDIVISYFMKFEIPQESQNIAKDLWRVFFRKPRHLVFTFWCAMVGVSFGLVWNFFNWLLEELAADYGPEVNNNIKTIEGIAMFIQTAIGETPAFFLGGWIVNKIGHGHSITLVLAIIGLRFTLYSFLVNPWWSLPIEILQNNYGLFYSAMTSYAKLHGPPGAEATIQSILCAACEGVGVAIGSFVAGVLYDTYKGSITFRVFGIAFFILAISNEAVEMFYRYIDRKGDKIVQTIEYR